MDFKYTLSQTLIEFPGDYETKEWHGYGFIYDYFMGNFRRSFFLMLIANQGY